MLDPTAVNAGKIRHTEQLQQQVMTGPSWAGGGEWDKGEKELVHFWFQTDKFDNKLLFESNKYVQCNIKKIYRTGSLIPIMFIIWQNFSDFI